MNTLASETGGPKRKRLIAPIISWTIVILAAVVVCLIVSLSVPILEVRTSVRQCTGKLHSEAQVEHLGGERKAASKVALYLKVPAWLAGKQEEAVWILGACGDTGIPVLVECTKHRSPSIRSLSAWLLGDLRSAEAVDALVGLLADRECGYVAAEALGKIGDARAVGPLMALLEANRNDEWAAEALGRIKDPRAIEVLKNSFLTGDAGVAKTAAVALAGIGTPEAVGTLDVDSQDTDRLAAAETAVGAVRNPEAVPILIGLLKHKGLLIRRQAASALGDIGDVRAVDALIGMISGGMNTSLDTVAAIKALGQIGDERALEPLVRLLSPTGEDEFNLHYAAASAIRRIGTPRAIEVLTKMAERDGIEREILDLSRRPVKPSAETEGER